MSEEESESITSSSSEEEDEDAKELTIEVEKKFLKTLQSLKTKDPAIYDANVKFFDAPKENELSAKESVKGNAKLKKAKPFLLSDYDKLLVQSGGEIREESDVQPSYNEEQESIKSNLKKALLSDDSDDDSSLLTLKPKIRTEAPDSSSDEETEIKHWLTGAKDELKDKNLELELKPLHDIWTNPELDDGETFLRDYILNKRYLDETPKKPESESEASNSEEESEFDEKQEEFEHKYNFRFEEPDQEFIKRYPRTMEASMRRKESKRKLKREQTKKNREEKLDKKKGEIKKLKSEKRKEILNHLKHLKSITGNETLAFKNEMLEGDFDPDEHDKIMEAMFNEEFYAGQDEEKPVFDADEDIDYPEYEGSNENGEEIGGDNSQEEYNNENEEEYNNEEGYDNEEDNHGEFTVNGELITDCDYNPLAAAATSCGRKLSRAKLKRLKRKEKKAGASGPLAGAAQKSLFAQAVERPKPVFNPKDETFMKYVDEYYGLEFEDLIGDLPCRFKYKRVVPNSYGLSVEEILAADDKELNKWCPVKKIYSQRSEHVEKNEVKVYTQRARDENLKKKLLPSLYKSPEEMEEEEENQRILPTEEERNEMMNKKQKKIKQISEQFEKEKQNKKMDIGDEDEESGAKEKDDVIDETIVNEYLKEKKKTAKAISNKRKLVNSESIQSGEGKIGASAIVKEDEVARKKMKKNKIDGTVATNEKKVEEIANNIKKRNGNSKTLETNVRASGKANKKTKENCDKPVENGIAHKEGEKKKRRKKKRKSAVSVDGSNEQILGEGNGAGKTGKKKGDRGEPVENGRAQKDGEKKKKRKKKRKRKKKLAFSGEGNKEEISDEGTEVGKTEEKSDKRKKGVSGKTDKKITDKATKGSSIGNRKPSKVDGEGKKPVDKKKKVLKNKIIDKQGERTNLKRSGKGDKFKKKSAEKVTEFSDARLKAYGINPKKFKSKLLYGNKDKA